MTLITVRAEGDQNNADMASSNGIEIKQLSRIVLRSEPVASFLQGSLIWIAEYEELIDGRRHTFVSIHPRAIGHSPYEDLPGYSDRSRSRRPLPSSTEQGPETYF